MRAAAVIFKVLMWGFTVFYVLIQAMAVFGLMSNNAAAVSAGQTDKVYNVIPLICATLIMLAATILFVVLRRRRYIGLLVAVVAAAVMLVVALDLGRAFPSSIGSGDTTVGLTMTKLIWRHMGIALVPLMMLGAWLFERAADKADELFMERKTGYDLSGGAIFADLDGEHDEQPTPRRLKRSLRKRLEKESKPEDD